MRVKSAVFAISILVCPSRLWGGHTGSQGGYWPGWADG
jgi:hypothetical protein